MKTVIFSSVIMLSLGGMYACSSSEKSPYVDLTSGKEVELIKDEKSGLMINAATDRPVILYVDTRSSDTFYNPASKIVNGKLQMVEQGVYVYNDGEKEIKIDGEEYKMKDGDSKTKIEGDEYKYENGDVTIKREGGEYKIERKGYTKKVDEDGDIKIETKDTKTKIDGETGEIKVKKKSVFSKVKDKVTGN
jgi:hypothetical protein